VPEIFVPDNLKSAVRKTYRYEPDINPSYQQLASLIQAKVHVDYHFEYDKHYYSVPHYLAKLVVEVHASATTVVIYHLGTLSTCFTTLQQTENAQREYAFQSV